MFEIDKNRRSLSSVPLIKDNLEVIHAEDIPFLYFGTNKYGSRIIGSFLLKDEETDNLRYAHVLVDNNTFHKFLSQQISFREIIERSADLYVIDKNAEERPIAIYSISADLIPDELLPAPDYFCPKYNFAVGNDFVLSLHGSIADTHLAFPFELSNIQKNFEKVLKSTLEVFERLEISPVVKQKAYSEGSFQLRFNISFTEYNELFIKQESLYNSVSNILKHLIPTANQAVNNKADINQFMENPEIIDNIKSTLEKGGINVNEQFLAKTKTKFEKVLEHYNNLSANLGNSYNEIELLVEKRDSKDLMPIQLINNENQSKLEKIITVIDSDKYKMETDTSPKKYKISVYALNTESRIGKALIYNQFDEEAMDKPSIKIEGNGTLDQSIFTESLHLNKWITIDAQATLKNGRFSKLVVVHE